MNNLWQDLRYGLRMLRKAPGFSLVAIAALALGIGANTAIFTVLNGVLLRPLPFAEPSRLFVIGDLRPQPPFLPGVSMSDRHYVEYERSQRSFESVTTFGGDQKTLTGAGDPARLAVTDVTSSFFGTLRATPLLGRAFLPENETAGKNHVVVLSHRLWLSRFNGDRRVLGSNITLDGEPYVVIGVMPASFAFPADAELWLPLHVVADPHTTFARPAIGRLKPGVSQAIAQSELDGIIRSLPLEHGDKPSKFVPQVQPLKELLVGTVRKSLWVFAGAVAFVLLIACANVANLLLMRTTARRQEIAARAALGATRLRLIRQLLTESLTVALFGGGAGTLLALWIVPALLKFAPAGRIPRIDEVRIDPVVLLFTFGISLLTGMVFGMAPAFHATRRDLRTSLALGERTSTFHRQRLRNGLVVSEIALALVLLTGAGLLVRSFMRIQAVDPGFQPERVLTMSVDLPHSLYQNVAQMQSFHARMLEQLAALPGVNGAAAVNFVPLGGMLIQGDFQLEGQQLPPNYMVDKLVVSPGYFRTLGIRLVRGRDFSASDGASAPRVVMVTKSVAEKLWPGQDPLGRRISMEDKPKESDWLTVVGVVEDVRQQGLTSQFDAATYQPIAQTPYPFFLGHMTFVVKTTGEPLAMAAGMRNALRVVDKDQPLQSITTMTERIAGTMVEPRFQMNLLGAFAALALGLAAIGVYGVMSYSMTERTREIGIRMALGARAPAILRMMLRQTAWLVAAGIVIGFGGALAVTRVLAKWLFEIKPTDVVTLAGVMVLLASVALLAGLLPARRATRVDPMIALRNE